MDEENQKDNLSYFDKDDPEDAPEIVTHWRLVREPALLTRSVLSHAWEEGRGTASEPYLVDFLPNINPPNNINNNNNNNNKNGGGPGSNAVVVVDPRNPLTMPKPTRWFIASLNATATLALTFASSAYTSSIPDLQLRLGVSSETAFLGTSLFVLGFALGPLVWAPLSESFGRRAVFLATYGAFVLLNAAAALADDIAVVLAARGLGGMVGASALVNSSSGVADLFSLADRGKANAYFSAAPFLGPVLGPILGGFLSQGAGGWKGVGGAITGVTALVWVTYYLVVPETYAPVLLRLRAARLTRLHSRGGEGQDEDQDKAVYYQSRLDWNNKNKAPGGGGGPPTVTHMLRTALVRPFLLLFSETIVVVLSVYMAIIFGAMYLMFAAFPIVFRSEQGYNFSQAVSGLAFLGIAGGMVLALVYMLFQNKAYLRIAKAAPGGRAPPEARLRPARLGAVMAPAGLAVFAATNSPEFHFLVPILGTVPFGFGMVVIFISLLGYLVDTYTVYAASAIAAATAVRSVFGAVFPLFTKVMFARLGVHGGAAVPAGLAALCLPFPFLFVRYGKQIREKAKFATEARNIAMKMMAAAGAAAAAAAAAAKASGDVDEKKSPVGVVEQKDGIEEKKERPLSEAHGPTAEGEMQCYGRYCLGCAVDEGNFFVCRNASLYERKDWAMQ